MSNQENDNQPIIEDLPADDAREEEIKGGAGAASGGVWKTANFLTN